ncbi:hypothetical protein MRX96_019178 [Rhipicephalus microplus]
MGLSVEDNVPGNVRNRHLDADELFNAVSIEESCECNPEWLRDATGAVTTVNRAGTPKKVQRSLMDHSSMQEWGQRQMLMLSDPFQESIQMLACEFLNHSVMISLGILGGANSDV